MDADIKIIDVGPDLPSFNAHQTIFNFERNFFSNEHVHTVQTWMSTNWYRSILYALLYIFVVFTGKNLMRNRPRFELRPALAAWNVMLASFSFIGCLRVLPEFVYVLKKYGFEYSLCNNSNAYGVAGFWTWMFCLSKVPELIDTVFIVLRKQPLIFLHWFHHSTVLIYAWYSYHDFAASGRWFVVMNYAVHSIMYSYYAMKALKFTVPKSIAMFITMAQLSQMIVGCYVNFTAWNVKRHGRQCRVTDENIQYSFIMYFMYFMLFAHFFINTYCVNLGSTDASQQKKGSSISSSVSQAAQAGDDKSQESTRGDSHRPLPKKKD